MSDQNGKQKLSQCMEPHLLDLACDTVAEEMETRRKNSILPGIEAVTPAFMENWNLDQQVDHSPFLSQILETAAQTERAKLHNKKKKPHKLCQVVTQQLLYQSSNSCIAFQAAFGLFLWSTGSARQTIDAAFRCGLSVGYDSVLKHIGLTADGCMEKAIRMAKDPHSFNYDNMNISTSIFVEQRGARGPAKVTSGTFGIFYGLRNATWEHMLIEPIMNRLWLRYRRSERPQHPISVGYKTPQGPVRASTTEEATTRGTLQFHDEVYIDQLKRDPEFLSKYAIPGFHDQLTNASIRSGQLLRVKDVDAWERREIFQLGVNEEGSLSYFFLLMEKARLGNDQPDYHTLLAALMQVLDGLLLDAWMRECGFPTLRSFAESKPTPEKLREIAARILTDYATPMPDATTSDPDIIASDDESTDSASSSGSEDSPAPDPPLATSANPKDDIAHQNIRLLTRDLPMVAVLEKDLVIAKGMNSTWDRLGNISAAIVHIHGVKNQSQQP
ncbi:hypothetical protein B0H13DRAFT_1864431 [Mycena leptocephala]|nr:hypothetical protein B0H13DRAFT_1864431 [Mycena leptocephala]